MQRQTTEQTWSTDVYERNARFVSDHGESVVDWLEPQKGERILDLGCGDGVLTHKLVARGAEVVGVDHSKEFVESARARGLDVRHESGDALSFHEEFDAVFSNAALHWMTNARDVIDGVARALKRGGRFVGEFGGHGNVAAIVTAMRAVAHKHGIDEGHAFPWFFPTTTQYADMLGEGGFKVDKIVSFNRPTPLPGGVVGWIETFRAPFFHAAGAKGERIIDEIEALLSPSLRDHEGQWTADYVRLRFVATKV
ncbi:MAG: methyltransferase domain-containing protein [Pseudomonadota bacterium]